MQHILKSVKAQMIVFLSGFALYLIFSAENYKFLAMLLVAVASALLFEALAYYIKTKKWSLTESAAITGLIIGFVLSSKEPVLHIIGASAIAIGVKHMVQYKKGRHIFNPAASGVLLICLFTGSYTQWAGTYFAALLAVAGFYFAYRFKKVELLLGYFAATFLFFGVQAVAQGNHLKDVFGYLSYFYIFIMVIEPKTTPVSQWGKYIFGAALGVMIFAFTQMGLKTDVELLSLLIMNMFTPVLNNVKLKTPGGKS